MASPIPVPLSRSRIHPLRLRLLPRQPLVPRRHLHISSRLLEFKAPSLEPIVLEKPDKFRPPSHPQRLNARKKRMTYGRDLNEEEREQQDGKQYPYSFPPKQSFMHWFLHNRSIHVYISISVLAFLALFINVKNFERVNKFPDLLPHGSLFFQNPIRFIYEYIQVYRMHSAATHSELTAMREQEVDDSRKRRVYREAHNIPEVKGLASRLGLGTVEEDTRIERSQKSEEDAGVGKESVIGSGIVDEQGSQIPLADGMLADGEQESRPKRRVRKWFGIW